MSKYAPIFVKMAKSIVNIIPNHTIFQGFANLYLNKYHNFSNVDMYRNGEHRWLKQAISSKQNPMIFDVGANVGKWTLDALSINSSAIIHSFEPTPAIFEKLSQQIFPPSVSINKLGLGDIQKVVSFYEYGEMHTHNSLYQSHTKPYQSKIDVHIDTIDNYCLEKNITHIDYLKVDTEGNDYYVLVGAKRMLENAKIDIIQFEYGNKYIDAKVFLKDIFDLIEPLNYSIYRIMPKSLLFIPKYHNSHEKFIYSNYTIIHNSVAQTLGIPHR